VRSIKSLGIATAVALALIAVAGASAASAALFHGPSEHAETLTGSRGASNHVLSLGPVETYSCSAVSFSDAIAASESASFREFTVSPELNECKKGSTPIGGWHINGCQYRFHAGPSNAEPIVGWVDITGCEAPMSYTSTFPVPCTVAIGNQNGIGKVEYKNSEENMTPVLIVNLSNLTYTRSGEGCSWGTGTFTDGKYTGEWNLKARWSEGTQVPLYVSPNPPELFHAEEAPITIAGSNLTTIKAFNFHNDGYLWCENQTYNGTSSNIAPSSLTVAPAYQTCTWYVNEPEKGINNEFPLPNENISAGGCSFTFSLLASFSIGGSNCASNPITVTRTGCTVTVGPQSHSGLVYTGPLSGGKNRSVQMNPSGTSATLTYTATGSSCPEQGTFSNGYLSSKVTFSAKNSTGEWQGLWLE
jgi:hypothetical protein